MPELARIARSGLTYWSTPVGVAGDTRSGIVVAFTERGGGVSAAPFSSLNLAAHVGDDPGAVDENRTRLLEALDLASCRETLTMAEQVHGDNIALIDETNAGSGARASGGAGPVTATDALMTVTPGVPLMLCFADCVPVVLIAPGPAIAVVHAGWRGALAGLAGKAVRSLAQHADCDAAEIRAFIGPHIRACHYEVDATLLSHFINTFGTFARAGSGGLDLEAVILRSLTDAGVAPWRTTSLGACTAEATDRFFSYRAEGAQTGRHGALACIVP